MLPTLASVFLDYVCNFSCAHCSIGSTPKTKFKMSDEVFEKMFEGIEKIKSLRVIVFTGGEATVHPEMLHEGIKRSKKLGLVTRLVTNAWWAKTPEKAYTYLEKLVESGLDEINTSYDDFHEPFMELARVGNLIDAAMKLNMSAVGIGVINDKDAKYTLDFIKTELSKQLKISEKELSRYVVFVDDYATPSGSGEDLDVSGLDAGSKLDIGCPEIMKTLSFQPDGSIKACCGHGQLYLKDLTVGNLKNDDLQEIVDRGTENILYWWIHYVGPKKILERLGVVDDKYASICHACTDLLGKHREKLVHYLQANKDDIFTNEVLLSGHIKNMADWVVSQEEIIVGHIKDMGKDRVKPGTVS